MKKQSLILEQIFLVVVWILLPVLAFAQTTQNREVDSFSELSVSGAFTVYLSQGDREALRVEAKEEHLDDIVTEVRGGRLRIGVRNSGRNNTTGSIYLTVKNLNSLTVSGACKISSETSLRASDFELKSSGASKVTLALEVKDLDLHSSGASSITLSGSANMYNLSLSGASNINTFELRAQDVEVSASGASKVDIYAENRLNVNTSGATKVRYKGSPQVESVKASGASSVKKAS